MYSAHDLPTSAYLVVGTIDATESDERRRDMSSFLRLEVQTPTKQQTHWMSLNHAFDSVLVPLSLLVPPLLQFLLVKWLTSRPWAWSWIISVLGWR